jgi:hypothetical protein
VLLFFSVARSPEIGSGERAVEGPTNSAADAAAEPASAAASGKPTKAAKAPVKPKFGEFNIPSYISSPFQAHQWLDAA